MRLLLLGPPGAGKGTQARMLSEKAGVPQIASGDLLRAAVREGTALGIKAQSFMDRGELAPDELVVSLIEERLSANDAQHGFILDGFPRSVAQAEALATMLQRRGTALDRVIAVIVSADEIVRRISGRRTCRNCAAMYHVLFEPPHKPGVCDKCGGELYQREDDSEETVRKRLKVYEETTRPLLEYYGRKGILAQIDGMGRLEDVEQRMIAALNGLVPGGEKTRAGSRR